MDYGYGGGDGDGGGSAMDVLSCDMVLVTANLSLLWRLGLELYRSPFTKVARVDLA
jgi:hypothetical protein